MSGVQHLTIGEDEPDQRLDRWFRKTFPHVSQGRIEKLCRKGDIRVDGSRVKPAMRVGPGDVIRVPPLPDDPAPTLAPIAAPIPDDADTRAIRAAVVHRDEAMIVLNKPAGLAVQGGSGQSRHLGTLLSSLRFGRDDDPRLVHRLDRDTSGLLVLARTPRSASHLARLFRTRSVEKIYFAATAGRPEPDQGTIRAGLVKEGGERMRVLHPDAVADTQDARHALTDYRVIDAAGRRAAWVALRPVTGRTHQLRAHMAALGTPIAGDGKYGGRGQENQGDGWGASLGGALSRKLHLHAWRLSFPHPETGRGLSFVAPLPDHMARTWGFFGWSLDLLPDPVFDD